MVFRNFKYSIMKTSKLFLALCFVFFTLEAISQTTFIYVSDAGGFNAPPWQILRYNLDGSNPHVLIDNDFFTGQGVGWPQDILFLENENAILVSCLVGNKITKHNASTGAFIEDFATIPGGPTRMKIGPDGKIYVVQWSLTDNKVLRFDTDGTPLGPFTNVGIVRSIGLDWDADDNLYVTSYGGNKVHKFDSNGTYVGEFINTDLSGPTNVLREDSGNYLVLNWSGNSIERFDMDGTHLETFTTEVTQPEGIAKHPNNNNYLVGNGGNASVDQFAPDGTFVESTVPSGSGGLIQPNAVTIIETTLSTNEFSKKKVMVTPSVGNIFNLNTLETTSLESLELFNIQGQKITTIDVHEYQWNGNFLQEGLYFLRGRTPRGSYVQKIIIKK